MSTTASAQRLVPRPGKAPDSVAVQLTDPTCTRVGGAVVVGGGVAAGFGVDGQEPADAWVVEPGAPSRSRPRGPRRSAGAHRATRTAAARSPTPRRWTGPAADLSPSAAPHSASATSPTTSPGACSRPRVRTTTTRPGLRGARKRCEHYSIAHSDWLRLHFHGGSTSRSKSTSKTVLWVRLTGSTKRVRS